MFRGSYSERLTKRVRRGYVGHPMATIAFYGPDDSRASKLVVTIIASEGEENGSDLMKKWFSDTTDLRWDDRLCREVVAFIDEHGAKSVAMPEAIVGCPHQEG